MARPFCRRAVRRARLFRWRAAAAAAGTADRVEVAAATEHGNPQAIGPGPEVRGLLLHEKSPTHQRAVTGAGGCGSDMVDGTGSKAPEIDPALHKKMLQLLSSLWVTRAIGAFARLGLADVLADGAQDGAAIAAACGLLPDRVDRLLRALCTV